MVSIIRNIANLKEMAEIEQRAAGGGGGGGGGSGGGGPRRAEVRRLLTRNSDNWHPFSIHPSASFNVSTQLHAAVNG